MRTDEVVQTYVGPVVMLDKGDYLQATDLVEALTIVLKPPAGGWSLNPLLHAVERANHILAQVRCA